MYFIWYIIIGIIAGFVAGKLMRGEVSDSLLIYWLVLLVVSWAAGYSVCLVLQQLVLLAVLLPLLWELYYCCGLFLCSRGLIFLEL
jgi:uncharacterized membrane protein YeaQ/YmgE (transglycosylase-associated protein family)